MSKTSETKPIEGTETPTPRKTVTNWRVFEEGNFLPVRIRCDGYKSTHPGDMSCHTNFEPTSQNVIRHMNPDHGGGWFRIKFRISDGGKKSTLWRELEEAGVELQDFHCPHCREDVPLTPRRIIYHLQNHPGAIRVNLDPQVLCMELGYKKADLDEMDDLYDTRNI
jgi:hypothetical protein